MSSLCAVCPYSGLWPIKPFVVIVLCRTLKNNCLLSIFSRRFLLFFVEDQYLSRFNTKYYFLRFLKRNVCKKYCNLFVVLVSFRQDFKGWLSHSSSIEICFAYFHTETLSFFLFFFFSFTSPSMALQKICQYW